MEYGRPLDCFDAAPGERSIFALRPGGPTDHLPQGVAAFAAAAGFRAAHGEVLIVPQAGGIGALLGLGPEQGPEQGTGQNADQGPYAYGALPAKLPPGTWGLAAGAAAGAATGAADGAPAVAALEDAALGFALGAYRQTALKAATASDRARLSLPEGAAPNARRTAEAVWFARDLINAPANILGPAELADAAAALGGRFGATVRRTSGAALAEHYPALAAVAAGSDRPGAVVRLDWRGTAAGADAPHVFLCGKGVCFDTGGYDLKPSPAMLKMKKDMGGAAVMLAAAQTLMARDASIRLSVLVGCVENSVSGHAMRPQDVLRTRRGLTVEVGNTDAEGRLVLADLLAEASDERPDLLIDAATLTGAARVALGPEVVALFANDDAAALAFTAAGERTGDFIWRLPLHAGYRGWLDSPTADLNSVSGKPFAGAIVAALFLERFVTPGVPWVHLDLYASNDMARPGRPEGGEATGLRAIEAGLMTIIANVNRNSSGAHCQTP